MLPRVRLRNAGLPIFLLSLTASGCGREGGESRPDAGADSTQTLRRRIVALEAGRSFGAGELERQVRHPDPRVRRAAAVALGRIQDRAALPWLLPALEDPDSSVAEQAAFALGQLQGLQDADRYALQQALVAIVDQRPTPRNAPFVEALGKQGGPEVAPVLEQSLASGILAGEGSHARAPELEGAAAWGLARLHTAQARSLLADVGDLRNRTGIAPMRIAAAMASDPDSAYRVPLQSLLDHPDRFARAAGARALGKQHDRSVVPALVGHLSDLDWQVRASILLALSELADRKVLDAQAAEFGAALLADSHPLVREAAAVALDSLGIGPHRALLEKALADPTPAVRLAASRALCRAGGPSARPAFETTRRDSIEFVRTGILDATGRVMGEPAAADYLIPLLQSAAVQDRVQAATALGTLATLRGPRREAVRAALEQALGDTDFVVAASAAEALGKIGGPATIPPLAGAYDAHLNRPNGVDVRLAALEAASVALAGTPRSQWTPARALFERAAHDPDPRAVHSAAVGMARLEKQPEPPPALPRARAEAVSLDSLPAIDLGIVPVRLVTAHGEVVLELDGDRYPRTVANFLRLVDAGFYARGVFHRVVPAFVVQGGCPRGDGWGDAGYSIPCEYGDLRYDDAGIVGMAHAGKDTGGSQFFITHVPVPRLDGRYTAFGRVRDGMAVVDRIVRGDRFRIERVEGVVERR